MAELIHSHFGSPPAISNQRTGDVILTSHVAYPPFDIDALIDAQLGLGLRPPLMSSGQGLTGLAPRRCVMQRRFGYPRDLNEAYWRSDDFENDISQFYFN